MTKFWLLLMPPASTQCLPLEMVDRNVVVQVIQVNNIVTTGIPNPFLLNDIFDVNCKIALLTISYD